MENYPAFKKLTINPLNASKKIIWKLVCICRLLQIFANIILQSKV